VFTSDVILLKEDETVSVKTERQHNTFIRLKYTHKYDLTSTEVLNLSDVARGGAVGHLGGARFLCEGYIYFDPNMDAR
jgi:hypothetical protein